MSFTMAIELMGGLGLFLYGMSVMSEGLQRVAGEKLRGFLRTLTKNRFAGIFTGFTVTGIVQSSSATTVMLVGFVNAGLLDLTQAVGVVMGANIGTTVTGWLVALLGFKIKIATLALPAVGVGFFVRFIGKQKLTDWGAVLLGFGILFLGLTFMKDSVGELRKSQEIMEWLAGVHVGGLGTYLIAVAIGSAVTMVIQSSSATMALTMTIAQQGLIDFPTAAALILGENIGTTITANLAAIGTTPAAKRTARAHLVFNVSGVLWMMVLFWWFTDFIDWLVPGEVFSEDIATRAKAIPDHMAAFHTVFNCINTLLFLPLVPILAMVARKMVKDKEGDEKSKRTPLKFIHSDIIGTSELDMEEVRQTLVYMGNRLIKGIDILFDLVTNPNDKDFEKKSAKIMEIEQESDDIEEEITDFIIKLSRSRLSTNLSQEINAVTGSAHDFERIGDHLRTLLALVQRKKDKNFQFSQVAMDSLREMMENVQKLMEIVTQGIVKPYDHLRRDALKLEKSIDLARKRMREDHIRRLTEGSCDVKSGILFVELLTSFEKIGDHAFNIAEDFSIETDEEE